MPDPAHRDAAPRGRQEPRPHDATSGVTYISPPTDGEHAEALAESTRAFGRGDYRLARELARRVTVDSSTEAEREFASQILHRTGIDPVALGIGIACLGLFGLVVWWAV